MSLAAQLLAVDRGMEIVASFPEWRNTPIILGESDPEGCAACQGAQNGYRNGPLYGATIGDSTARTYELARKNRINLAGIVTWAFEFEDQPYFAGFRELATNGVDKAVLNVFRMLGMLGGDWVKVESSGAQTLSKMLQEGVIDAPDIAVIPPDGPGAGGTILLLQKWSHDAAAWESLPVARQEQVIGRTKLDSVELEDRPPEDRLKASIAIGDNGLNDRL